MATPLRLLILEDNPSDAELALHALRRAGYDPTFTRVETEEDYLEQLQSAPEIILADFTMPMFDSLRALEILGERHLDIPFIIVSGTIGEERAVQVMQRGATDYIMKDRLGRLGQAVDQALARWKLKEEKLKAEQTVLRLATIVETSGDAIIAKTLDGNITSWNRAAENLYGYPAEEVLGKHISLLFPQGRRKSDAPEDFDGDMMKVSAGEHIDAFETVRVRKDGRRIEVLLSISPIRDGHGIVIGASAIALDITQRKRTERFLNAEQAVTGILTECKSLEEAGPRVLQTVAECLRWEVAVLWTIDRKANVLRRLHLWHATWAEESFIEALSRRMVLQSGAGIAGRVWSLGEPIWEPGIASDNLTSESSIVIREGLRCGFGLPMRQGVEMVGVIEFYNPELREPDKLLVATLDNIACQVSQFCERRRSEIALQTSEEQFRQLADAMPQIVWTARPDGTIDYCNERWYEFSGASRDEDPEHIWRPTIHPDDLQCTMDAWAHSARTGAAYENEVRHFDRKAGRYRWFLFRAVAGTDGAEAVTRWYGTGTDIDDQKKILDELRISMEEQKRSLKELQISEERYRNLVCALPAAVYTTDATGLITLFNEHAVKLWGRRPELGKDRWCGSWKLLRLDGTPLPLNECPMAVTLRQGSGVHGEELIIERPDGFRAHVLKHPELLYGPNGEIVGAVNMVIDITQKKQLEAQFRQSQKMDAVGQLAAGVAHDFNNLLTIILGYSELLLLKASVKGAPGSKDRESIELIHKAGERAAGLTRQLLAFGRKQILTPIVLDLNSLVAETEKMLRRLLGEDLEVIIHVQPGLGRVKADPGQVEQIVMNLAVNARDAMPRGGRLTIETRDVVLSNLQAQQNTDVRAGPYVRLTVTDSGSGMTEATKARLFEPFFTTKEVGKGTGLGLATVFGIVKQSGGFVEVDSTLGSGSSFRVYFPQVREAVQLERDHRGLVKLPGGMETILLVEDENGLRELAQLVLEAHGYKVLSARDGVEAIKVCQDYADDIHLMFTDVVMPKMSGRQLTDLLVPIRPNMKVLYMSGYTDDTIVRHGIEDEGTNFLAKPFTQVVLTQKVREVLDGTHGNHESAVRDGALVKYA